MPYSYEPFLEYQRKKKISDAEEEVKAKANTQLSIDVYRYFGSSGPVTKRQITEFLKHKESPMNEEITNTAAEAQLATATPLTDEELPALLARTGAEVAVTSDEAEVETLTVH